MMCILTMLLVVTCAALLVSSTMACHTPVVGDPWYRHADYDPDIKHLTICEGVTEIPYAYFGSGNTYSRGPGIESIDLPQSLVSIRARAFYQNTILNHITIPANVTSIDANAFDSCSGLESITFSPGSKLQTIGSRAFNMNHRLRNLTLPESVKHIYDYAFYGHNLYTLQLGSQLVTIDERAFFTTYSTWRPPSEVLPTLTIPNTTQVIGVEAFRGLEIYFDELNVQATQVHEHAFTGVRYKKLVLTGVETIASRAFYSGSDLDYIVIGSSVQNISNEAFGSARPKYLIFHGNPTIEPDDEGKYMHGFRQLKMTVIFMQPITSRPTIMWYADWDIILGYAPPDIVSTADDRFRVHQLDVNDITPADNCSHALETYCTSAEATRDAYNSLGSVCT